MAALKIQQIPPQEIDPNPWNPNRMDEQTFEAERQSIARYGFIDPVTVRPHPEAEGRFQIIDGEHRWRIAGEQNLAKIPCVVLSLSDPEAKRLTVVMNETRGSADDVALGQLLLDLQAQDPEGLADSLRYSQSELDHLLRLGQVDWDPEEAFAGQNLPAAGDPAEEEWRTIPVRVPQSVHDLWQDASDRLAGQDEDPLHHDPAIRNGQILERLLAASLAGP